jgi:hypothetical protein
VILKSVILGKGVIERTEGVSRATCSLSADQHDAWKEGLAYRVDARGFSLHAEVCCAADQGQALDVGTLRTIKLTFVP